MSLPVRPTYTPISRTIVWAWRAAYLNAMAQRGNFEVKPSSCCKAKESTFTTTPSMSYSSESRLSCHSAM